MLYTILRKIVSLTINIFFNSVYAKNLEHLPTRGPLIIAPNHPSTFLDPLVVSMWVKRPIYFLTNGGAFSSPLKKWLYSKLFMIPIYRQQDSNESSSKNEEVFKNCYDMLKEGKVIIIFPEGSSEDERKLRKIKTGLARIAFGAEKENNFNLDVKVVCVGINYTNPRKFQSKLFINFDNPIEIKDYKDDYEKDNIKAVKDVTNLVSERLTSLIVVTSDEKVDKLVRKIEILYTSNLKDSLNLTFDEREQIFTIAQYISDAVKYYQHKDNEKVIDLENKLEDYFSDLKKYQIRDETVSKINDKKHIIIKLIKYIPQLIIGFPFYILGLLHNYLPFIIPAFVAKKTTKYTVYQAPINIVTGIITFSIFYSIYVLLFAIYTKDSILTTLYIIILPISGYFTFYYWNYLRRVFESLRLFSTFEKGENNYSLRIKRDNLIKELENIKEEYLNS
ncbi:MAG: 1-acyl-sn-glycerol-3-phosphate acyltransferase [Candidatus Sericytochromatia bacterium]